MANQVEDDSHYNPIVLDSIVDVDLDGPDDVEAAGLQRSFSVQAAPMAGAGALMEQLGINVLQQLNVSYEITPETTALMGEQVDLFTGSVFLKQTDISLQGNSTIPVELTRKTLAAGTTYNAGREFGTWGLDLPHVSTTMATVNNTTFTGPWAKGKACSGVLQPTERLSSQKAVLNVEDYWNGDSVSIPGHGSSALLTTTNSNRLTKNNLKVECFTAANGEEGFIVFTPDGLKYSLDKLKLVEGHPVYKAQNEDSFPIYDDPVLPDPGSGNTSLVPFRKYHAFMLVTKVEDRFGNTVHYKYTGNNLTSIESNDGRTIVVGYSGNLISKATADGVSVSYSYENGAALKNVTRPDGKQWAFSYGPIFYSDTPLSTNASTRFEGDYCRIVAGGGKQKYITVTHPDGLVADFMVAPTLHSRTEVPRLPLGNPIRDKNKFVIDRCYATYSLAEKTIKNTDATTMAWRYEHSAMKGAFAGETKPSLTGIYVPAGIQAGDLKRTRVIAPDGSVTAHYFSRRFDWQEGSLVYTDSIDTDGSTLLRRMVSTFAKGKYVGTTGQKHVNNEVSGYAVLETQQKTLENSDVFTKDFSEFNSYNTPTIVKESNSLKSAVRWTKTTFYHDLSNWLLNVPAATAVSDNGSSWTNVSETTYYSATSVYKSLPYRSYSYGVLQKTNSSYHADGREKLIVFNQPNLWVQYEQYKRGIPQLVRLPKRYEASCTDPAVCSMTVLFSVSTNGTIAQTTDLNGNKTAYQYDALRRVTRIAPVDTVWTPTTISYGTVNGAPTQTVTQGNYRKVTTFDGLFRPQLIQEWDASVSGSSRYWVQQFNAYNNVIFKSYASTNASETAGTAYEYDGLQRISREYSTVDNSGSLYFYPAGHRMERENARGYVTTTSYDAWGAPERDRPVRIEDNLSTTNIGYNLFDNMVSIEQGGVTESRLYNARQQLCRIVRPDVGHTAYGYTTLGQIAWSAPGASGAAHDCNENAVPAAQRITYAYDNLGDMRTELFPDSTPDRSYVLDNQGNVTRLTAGAVIWNYQYNSKHLVTRETLSLDGKVFNLSHSYTGLGYPTSLTYPAGRIVTFNPNALGQQRQAGSYVATATYYPDGQQNQWSYGNGVVRKYTLDSQRRPQNVRDYYGSTNFINLSYGYDANHNVSTITDSLAPAYNLTLQYDASDRLDIANGQWGAGSFKYDELGNIAQQKLGSVVLNYSYSNNRLTGISGSQSRSLSYDGRGNITNNGLRSFSFNLANQLTGSGAVSYQYDGHNRLVKRSSGSGSSYHIYSQAGQLLHEVGTDGVSTDYIYLGSALVSKVKGSTASYVHTDSLGSPRLETNASRVIQSNSRQHYQPYGQRIPGTQYTDIGFTGHKHDGELGLTYMQQRYYDPVIGRFYSNDPVGFSTDKPMMFNRYAYANNNPYKFTDPDGRNPFTVIGSDTQSELFKQDLAEGGDMVVAGMGEAISKVVDGYLTAGGFIPGAGGLAATLADGVKSLAQDGSTGSLSGAVAGEAVGKGVEANLDTSKLSGKAQVITAAVTEGVKFAVSQVAQKGVEKHETKMENKNQSLEKDKEMK